MITSLLSVRYDILVSVISNKIETVTRNVRGILSRILIRNIFPYIRRCRNARRWITRRQQSRLIAHMEFTRYANLSQEFDPSRYPACIMRKSRLTISRNRFIIDSSYLASCELQFEKIAMQLAHRRHYIKLCKMFFIHKRFFHLIVSIIYPKFYFR